jgi:MFS transporter, FSR family, fosmidomycin resistance protein
VPALVPFIVAERHHGDVAASRITLAATLLSSVAQPAFGLLTDRRPIPWLVPAGMTLAGLGIAASGLERSYATTWLAIALSDPGVAIYHPESARLARAATCGSHAAMSRYSLGGTIGFAAGPILITPILAGTGPSATPLLAIPALLGALAITALLGRPGRATTSAVWRPAARGGDNSPGSWRPGDGPARPSPGGCAPSPGSISTPSKKNSSITHPPRTSAARGWTTSPTRSRWTATSSARCW